MNIFPQDNVHYAYRSCKPCILMTRRLASKPFKAPLTPSHTKRASVWLRPGWPTLSSAARDRLHGIGDEERGADGPAMARAACTVGMTPTCMAAKFCGRLHGRTGEHPASVQHPHPCPCRARDPARTPATLCLRWFCTALRRKPQNERPSSVLWPPASRSRSGKNFAIRRRMPTFEVRPDPYTRYGQPAPASPPSPTRTSPKPTHPPLTSL